MRSLRLAITLFVASALLAGARYASAAYPAPYMNDPTFLNGQLGLDHFALPSTSDAAGSLSARLDNGDLVVAGAVPQWGSANPANGLWNLGLVRYNSAGVRQEWLNPGAYGVYGNQYIDTPNSDTPTMQYIRDVKVVNNRIYVLMDYQSTPERHEAHIHNVLLYAFDSAGKSLVGADPIVFGNGLAVPDPYDFYGAKIVPMPSGQLIIVATAYDANGSFFVVTRENIRADGSTAPDPTWGTQYGTDSYLREYRANVNTTAYFATTNASQSSSDFYIAGSEEGQGDSDVFIVKISGVTGNYKPEFGSNGFVGLDFAQTGGSHDDYTAGIYVYGSDLWITAQVSQKCNPGVGVAKFDSVSGSLNTSFGNSGKLVFGGVGNAPFCFSGSSDDIPTALSANAGRLGIVGYHHDSLLNGGSAYDPILAVVDSQSGALLDFAKHQVTDAGGNRLGDGVFYDVAGGPAPNVTFTVSGNGRDTAFGNTLSFLTGQWVPGPIDRSNICSRLRACELGPSAGWSTPDWASKAHRA